MLFNSHLFIFAFLPVVLIGFYALSSYAGRAVPYWLLGASLVFYGWWSVSYLVLLVLWTASNYFIGERIIDERRQRPGTARAWLVLAITFNLVLLGYFKYSAFIVENVAALTGVEFAIGAVILPLAISFHTFQQIAYLVECLRSDGPRYSLLDYLQFVFFFPQLIAGPIVLHDELLPQLKTRLGRFDPAMFAEGVSFFVIGLLKKLCLADPLSSLATPVFQFAAAEPPAFLDAWAATWAFSLGLYFDFSAYSDMAIGLARMFGIRLPYNFNSPYKAASIVDFWRRWHITLSRWLQRYLYIPLGGSRQGQSRTYVNLAITMLLGGLWHGAAWTFIIWGALHGLFLIINHAWNKAVERAEKQGRILALGPVLAHALTLLAVVIAWVFFAAPGFGEALSVLAGMVGYNGFTEGALATAIVGLAEGIDPRGVLGPLSPYVALALGSFIVFALPNTQEIIDATGRRETYFRIVHRFSAATGALAGAAFLIALAFLSDVKEFVYFQF